MIKLTSTAIILSYISALTAHTTTSKHRMAFILLVVQVFRINLENKSIKISSNNPFELTVVVVIL